MSDSERLADLLRFAGSLVRAGLPARESTLSPELAWDPDRDEQFVRAAVRWAYREEGAPPDGKLESVRTLYQVLKSRHELAIDGLDANALEAIILPGLRPVADVRAGTFQLLEAGEFADLVTPPFRGNIESAISSVGCVTLPRHPSAPYAGTCFAVKKDVVMTNRHVAELFTEGTGTQGLRFLDAHAVAIDPLRERGDTPSRLHPVTRVLMVHPYWDMALLEVPGLPMKPLRLASHDLSRGRRRVAVIGYPAFDVRNPIDVQMTVFRRQFQVKRVAPGYITRVVRADTYGHDVSAWAHDASTLGGNSGSAIIDVETGHVLALHFGGIYKQENWSVPMSELARDPRVVDMGLDFLAPRPDPAVPWRQFWDELPAASATQLLSPPAQPSPPPAPALSASRSPSRSPSLSAPSSPPPPRAAHRPAIAPGAAPAGQPISDNLSG
ncbi:MAG: serine protease [Polyangiaceae bacterium]